MGAFVRPPEGSPDAEAGYIYSFGTPAGRFGPAYVPRAQRASDPEPVCLRVLGRRAMGCRPSLRRRSGVRRKVGGPLGDLISLANNLLGLFGIPVIIPDGDVSEMSVQYNESLDQYIVLYTDGRASVVVGTAPGQRVPVGAAEPGDIRGIPGSLRADDSPVVVDGVPAGHRGEPPRIRSTCTGISRCETTTTSR
jgi:hypothetical protein